MITALFALQVVFNRKHLWLPGFIERHQINAAKLTKLLKRLKRPAGWVDKVLKPRLHWATEPPLLQLIAVSVIALVVTVPALEFVPFASTIPMVSVGLFGAALLCRDGLVALLALLSTCATILMGIWLLIG